MANYDGIETTANQEEALDLLIGKSASPTERAAIIQACVAEFLDSKDQQLLTIAFQNARQKISDLINNVGNQDFDSMRKFLEFFEAMKL